MPTCALKDLQVTVKSQLLSTIAVILTFLDSKHRDVTGIERLKLNKGPQLYPYQGHCDNVVSILDP